MRKPILATLAVLGVSLAASALVPAAIAFTSVFPPNELSGDDS